MQPFRNLEERTKLRNDFWNHIDGYLDDIDCPKAYFQKCIIESADGVTDKMDVACWRYSPSHRIRVVHWMLSCAASEVFGDVAGDSTSAPEVVQNSRIDQSTIADPVPPSCGAPISHDKFPLGFSTGDSEVDDVLTNLRMKLLIQLEHDQKEVNAAISQIQGVTAGKAKPLKQAKMRKHNANPPTPSSKSKGKQQRRNR